MPDVELSDDLEQWRRDVAAWLADHVVGDYATLKGRGGPGDEEYGFDLRVEWERELGKAGFIGLGWPAAAGGRGASLMQQVIWSEEYTRAQAPVRVSHIAEHLLAPTVIAFGTPEMQERFLPPILRGDERWCQGYSEPNAGSDLANVSTKAVLDGDEWVINGQKVWTSLAQWAQWCFVIARTEAGSQRHKGLSFLLVPMDQPGIEIRPIIQITGGGEFNEVFFTDARTSEDLVVGDVGEGWRVAMGLLGFERGVSTLAQQLTYERELAELIDIARARSARGSFDPPAAGRRVDRGAHHPAQRVALHGGRRCARRGVVDVQAVLGHVAPRPRQPHHGHPRGRGHDRRSAALRAHARAEGVPVQPRRHHLRRIEPDPTERARGACARAAARAAAAVELAAVGAI